MNKINWKREILSILLLTLGAAVLAFDLKSFVNTGGLFPGGFSGVTVLAQNISSKFWDINIPYSAIYLPLNAVGAFIGWKYIGKKFTIYSFYSVLVTSVMTDLLPDFTITYDILLISIFGGILAGASVVLCLLSGASGGGTDFISIYLSEKRGIDSWNYILAGNVTMLLIAGILFGWDKALYSIIFQFTATQVIQMLYKRYQKHTLLIITEKPDEVYHQIKVLTDHDATAIDATGCYEGKPKTILYSVVGREQTTMIVESIKEVDPQAFINVLDTENLSGNFDVVPYVKLLDKKK